MPFYVDSLLLLLCVVVLVLWASAFPYPSVLIRWLLPPQKRWPEAQIRGWLKDDTVDKSYSRFFYRDPERAVPAETGLVSPADGLVTSLECRAGIRYIVIALSLWDVHVQRCPERGAITRVERLGSNYMDGEGRGFAFLAEKCLPVQIRIAIQLEQSVIAVRLITSLAARRLEAFVDVGDCVTRGQRLGRILLGSTVVLEVPEDWPVLVSHGARVTAGETLVSRAAIG